MFPFADQIHSWAKAHASSSGLPDHTPSQQAADPVNTEKPPQHGQVNVQVEDPTLGSASETNSKPGLLIRMRNGSGRFYHHTTEAICHSWINVLLIFVPVGIACEAAGLDPAIIFAMNAVAIIPLAGLLSHATESVASRLGDTIGALINVTFGNAVELIIFIIALVKNEIRIVQASLLGSILANLLLIMGMAFLAGGLRFREQIYNSTVTQMSACLLSLSVVSLLLPTAFHASWSDGSHADRETLKVSRGTSVVLLLVYILYIIFQLRTHSYLYASIPQAIIDEESKPGVLAEFMNGSSDSSSSSTSQAPEPTMSRTAAVVMLLLSTALVAVCAEFLVDAIPEMIASSNVSEAFIGLIILPIVGNAAEHVTAVSVAAKNKMDLSIGVSVGSSIQIAIFVTPLVVILGWCMDKDMSLYFTLFETICLFVTTFVVNFLVLDGRSNYLEGVLLIAAYIIIALSAFFYPRSTESSVIAGSGA
ncbi:Pc12g14430 [Penicillium rubens Wisconsin 54-1255]|uniref:Vacuolar calcium ion transporter n=1 Tax=Penicillium rubens (strain ATCC 28089 / DSM 1075 / NRRL 1951 / Wisconsin 54-1255) TaxID=500485 RepID=B6H114_PENRW|nr:Pc12g14430 [Penicillium rubens Wisconsin 54-1255]